MIWEFADFDFRVQIEKEKCEKCGPVVLEGKEGDE